MVFKQVSFVVTVFVEIVFELISDAHEFIDVAFVIRLLPFLSVSQYQLDNPFQFGRYIHGLRSLSCQWHLHEAVKAVFGKETLVEVFAAVHFEEHEQDLSCVQRVSVIECLVFASVHQSVVALQQEYAREWELFDRMRDARNEIQLANEKVVGGVYRDQIHRFRDAVGRVVLVHEQNMHRRFRF